MSTVKLVIPFYTTYGTNHQMALIAEEAAKEAGAETRLRRFAETAPEEVVNGQDAWKAQLEKMQDIPEVSHDDMVWANAYLLSLPTRYGNIPSQAAAFIDTLGPLWQKGELANKAFSAMTSTSTMHGGRETTLQALYVSAMHWGTVIVPPGYTDEIMFETGMPYGIAPTGGDIKDAEKKAIAYQAKRLVEMAAKLAA